MSLASLAKAVGELGGTPFSLGELDVANVAFDALDAFVPAGVIKSCRREAVEALVAARVRASGSGSAEGLAEKPVAAEDAGSRVELRVVRRGDERGFRDGNGGSLESLYTKKCLRD